MRNSRLIKIAAAAAAAGMVLAGCSGGSDSAAEVTQDSDGNYVVSSTSECAVVEQGLSYTVKLKITEDTDGNIVKVEDDGTSIPDGKEGAYNNAQAIFADLVGKNEQTISDVDAVSGATLSSEAILDAVKKGMKAVDQSIQSGS